LVLHLIGALSFWPPEFLFSIVTLFKPLSTSNVITKQDCRDS
jgi:hypothetical protein